MARKLRQDRLPTPRGAAGPVRTGLGTSGVRTPGRERADPPPGATDAGSPREEARTAAAQLQAVLDEVVAGRLVCSAATRHRMEGAVLTLEAVDQDNQGLHFDSAPDIIERSS